MRAYINSLRIFLLLFFAAVVLLPTLNQNFHFINESKGGENRTKIKKPNIASLSIGDFIKAFDDYFSDNFNLRQNFITFHNILEFKIFNISPVPKEVILGKAGWFYNTNCISNYKGANLFSEKEIIQIKNELTLRTKWASDRGIKYYLAIVPNKMSVYPEFLPNSVIKISDSTRYDQVVSLNNNLTVNIIDIKKNILKHKNESHYLYQHTDDHWNDLGAYFGYQEIMNRLNRDFPDLSPHSINDYEIHKEARVGNLAVLTNLVEYCPEKFIALKEKFKMFGHDGQKRGYEVPKCISDWDFEIVKVNENNKKLKCLIIRDSYSLLLVRFFQEHFRESVFIHDEWKYRMREDLILKEKPDVVINIMVETYLDKLLEFPFVWDNKLKIENNIQIKAFNNKYVCTESNQKLYANREKADLWETYTMIYLPNNQCALLSFKKNYLSADLHNNNEVIANKEKMSEWEKFTIVNCENNTVALKALNGKYWSYDSKSLLLKDTSDSIGDKEKFKLINQ